MNNTTIKLRIDQLKAMDEFVRSTNDETLFYEWIELAVPDEPDESDYEFIASDNKLYNDCVNLFKKIVNDNDAYY